MSVTTSTPTVPEPDQRVVLGQINWGQYLAISNALVDRRNPRMIYLDGGLTILVTSRRHDWYAETLGTLIVAVADGLGIPWEPAGQATYRREDLEAGVEGDKTYYFGEHADIMRGPVDIDLTTQPPPDLAIEVELTHPADVAVSVWGRLGVPEIWRFKAESGTLSFWTRRGDGRYERIERSLGLPALTPADVMEQLRLADSLGSSRWYSQLRDWVRDVLRPRLGA